MKLKLRKLFKWFTIAHNISFPTSMDMENVLDFSWTSGVHFEMQKKTVHISELIAKPKTYV